jgi:hypothetical protein
MIIHTDMNDDIKSCERDAGNWKRQRYLIASALFEYVLNEEGKPFELRRHSDLEDMQGILYTEYAEFIELLEIRKRMGHRNLSNTIKSID